MNLVVDSNVVFAGLLRESTTRGLLIDSPLSFMSPEWMLEEIHKYRSLIIGRSGLSEQEYDLLFALISEKIEIVPYEEYQHYMQESKEKIAGRDPGDVPFLALALARTCNGIWTNNTRHFDNTGVKLWTTQQIIAHLGK